MKIANSIIESIDVNAFKSLAIHPVANPVLQVIFYMCN